MLDLIFKNATVVDGSGAPAYVGDIGVKDGKIVTGCGNMEASKTVDASGKILSPGFIDSHSHMDHMLGQPDEVSALCKVSQGITSEITSQCGESQYPGRDTSEYFYFAEKLPKVENYAFLAGHSSIREKVMGTSGDVPSESQLTRMKGYVEEAMEHGCFGMSTGLIYIPGVYAKTDELIQLAQVLHPYGGIYATHLRSESDFITEAVSEAITIAKTADIPLFLSHHKIVGVHNWGKSAETLSLVHKALDAGMKITLDQYPYEASQSNLNTSIPPAYFIDGYDHFVDQLNDPNVRREIKRRMTADKVDYNCGYRNAGGFQNIVIMSTPNTPEAEGKSVADYAKLAGKDEFETYFDLLAANHGTGGACYFCMDENELDRIYLDENTVVGSDSVLFNADGPVHPRAYGALVRSLTYFCKKKKIVTLEKAIYKQTLLTAQRWGLPNKGLIRDGYDADLVLFDWDALEDTATYLSPRQYAKGIEQVYVGGALVCSGGRLTGAHPGKVIYAPRR